MTPQDTIYWVPIVIGLFVLFGYALPVGVDQITGAKSGGWMLLCIAGGGLLCVPVVQWVTLTAILVMAYRIAFKELK